MTEAGLRRGTSLTRMASSSAVTPSAGALCFFILTVYLLFSASGVPAGIRGRNPATMTA